MDLRETFVDAKDETFDESMELTEYQEILKTRGKENLINSTQAIEVTTYANEYKKGWDLGDIVDIKKESWGISMKKRIVEVEEIIENNNQRIIATFESPEVEELKEDEG